MARESQRNPYNQHALMMMILKMININYSNLHWRKFISLQHILTIQFLLTQEKIRIVSKATYKFITTVNSFVILKCEEKISSEICFYCFMNFQNMLLLFTTYCCKAFIGYGDWLTINHQCIKMKHMNLPGRTLCIKILH